MKLLWKGDIETGSVQPRIETQMTQDRETNDGQPGWAKAGL